MLDDGTKAALKARVEAAAADGSPADTAKACRNVLLDAVRAIYAARGQTYAKDASLLELLQTAFFTEAVGDREVLESLHLVRMVGINALHGKHVKRTEAKLARESVLFFLDFMAGFAEEAAAEDRGPPEGVPAAAAEDRGPPARPPAKPAFLTEAATRRLYIDLYLREAGWDVLEKEGLALPGKAGVEIEVTGMPNESGVGYCDYVLYDTDGKALAVVEAKKTTVSVEKGRHQASLYADCLEARHGVRPVIYLSNGYEIRCSDGLYPERRLLGFHAREELQRMIQRRGRSALGAVHPDPDIAGRPYQAQAIAHLCEAFDENRRRGLLVMATGTGKTRVAVALTDVLSRAGWVKNVLFLADRTALVRQARKAFVRHLPDMSLCTLSEAHKPSARDARVILSTYQTMIHYIDGEEKEFTPGRFDLVIIDEAHRSVFNKYGIVFDYFDALLVGLTATPKSEVDANTYALFDCESGVPDFDYPLEKAVEDGYLVPPRPINRTTQLMRDGIAYEELSAEDKEKVDDLYPDGEAPEIIPGSKLFRLIYNKDTCREVLQDLMENGRRVAGGETLGKSIVFAYDHRHAEMLVECFHELYPKHGDAYCRLVDHYVAYADDLVEKFGTDPTFRIAVSVDMLDTGVDVPEVLNLSFFKPVRSMVRLVQMIGRGTRLCPNVFGPATDGSEDKRDFFIFDYCGNLEFMGGHPDTEPPARAHSLTEKILAEKVGLVRDLQSVAAQQEPWQKSFRSTLAAELLSAVKSVKANAARLAVRREMETVDRFLDPVIWRDLSPLDENRFVRRIAPLVDPDETVSDRVKAFDLRMHRIERGRLDPGGAFPGNRSADVAAVRRACATLLLKGAIPEVMAAAPLLEELNGDTFWTALPTVETLEDRRRALRGLMVFLEGAGLRAIDTNAEDHVLPGEPLPGGLLDIRTYRQKVLDWLEEHADFHVLQKLRNLEPVDASDLTELERILWQELGTKEDYEKAGCDGTLTVFVRSLVGLSRTAVQEKFGAFLAENDLNARQQEFIETVVDYAARNGDVTGSNLVNDEPFSLLDIQALFGEKIFVVKHVVDTLHNLALVA